eukprot:3218542-Rhodomonas_salina.1
MLSGRRKMRRKTTPETVFCGKISTGYHVAAYGKSVGPEPVLYEWLVLECGRIVAECCKESVGGYGRLVSENA